MAGYDGSRPSGLVDATARHSASEAALTFVRGKPQVSLSAALKSFLAQTM
jgi:hypothetical protein